MFDSLSLAPFVAGRSLLADSCLHLYKTTFVEHSTCRCTLQHVQQCLCRTTSASVRHTSLSWVLFVGLTFFFRLCLTFLCAAKKWQRLPKLGRLRCILRVRPYPERLQTVSNYVSVQPNISKSFGLPSNRSSCMAISLLLSTVYLSPPGYIPDDFICTSGAHSFRITERLQQEA